MKRNLERRSIRFVTALALVVLALAGRGSARAEDGAESADIVREQALRLIREHLPLAPEEVRIEGFRSLRAVEPGEQVRVTADPDEDFLGLVPLHVSIRKGGRAVYTGAIRGTVAVASVQVRASRALPKGYLLRPQDISTEKTWDGGEMDRPTVEEAVGAELLRPVGANQPLRRSDFSAPTVIRRGEVVQLDCVAAGLQVSAMGRAMRDARLGEVVAVQNLASKRQVFGRVLGPQWVRVPLAGGDSSGETLGIQAAVAGR